MAPQNRKRQRAETDLLQDDPPPLPSKKFKPTKKHRPASNFSPEFYDSLSKVWLTRRALRELDRRNRLKGNVYARAPAVRQVSSRKDRRDLQQFARHGGPELGDLRGYPEPAKNELAHAMGSKRSSRSSGSFSKNSKSTKSSKPTSNDAFATSNTESSGKKSSAYDPNFERHLIDHGIYFEGYEHPDNRKTPEPDNLEEIRRRLAIPRPSLSPSQFSDSAFRDFKRANTRVIEEGEVMREVIPTICGKTNIPSRQNLMYTRLESITNQTTVTPKPDLYDGVLQRDIDKRVIEDIDKDIASKDEDGLQRSYIIPTKHYIAPVAPNFFIEAKAPRGGADVAKRQITYDLSLGARGMHQLQSYAAGEPVYDNNAYTLGATYHAGNLNMYATHATPTGPGGSPEYHTSQVDGWNTIGNFNTYLQGATALRNSRNVSMEWRNQLISAANERAQYAEPSTLDSSYSVSETPGAYRVSESQTSANELATASFSDHFEELEPSGDKLAASFSYPARKSEPEEELEPSEDELAISFYKPDTPVSYPVKKSAYKLSDVEEGSETSTEELTTSKPASSRKRPIRERGKTKSKVPRHGSTSGRKHLSRR